MKQLLFVFLFFLSITSGFAEFDLEKLKSNFHAQISIQIIQVAINFTRP